MDLPAFISPFIIGSSIIAILFPTCRLRGVWLVLTIGLGAGLGLGITSATIFLWLALIGTPDSCYFAAELSLAVVLVFFAFYRTQYSADPSQKKPGFCFETNPATIIWLRNIFLFLLLISVGSFLLKTFLQDPHGKWDAVDTWNFRARWLFRGGADWSYAFSLRARDGLDYPLLITASVFRMWQILGKDPIVIPIFIAGSFTFGSVLLLFSSIALLRGRNQGYLAAILLFLSTQYLNIGTYQYADVPLAFFILATVFLFSLKDRCPELSSPLVFLAGVTVSCAAWTKNEGQLFLALVILIYFVGRLRKKEWAKTLKEFIGFTLGLAPVLGTLVYFKLNFALENAHIGADSLKQLGTYLFDIDRYILVGKTFMVKFLTFNDGIVWLMAGYLFLAGLDRPDLIKKRASSPVFLLLLMTCSYFFVYIIYPGNPRDLLSASLRRIIIQLWLTWVFLFFYCVKGPEKNASISTDATRSS
ncbi:MAG: phospholipid carrier-dependent glycosyltransferase [Desulfobacterales bacterium]